MKECIVISTFSDDLNVLKSIQKELLENHFVAGCQVSSVDSTYWWDNNINETREFCLQMRTKKSLYDYIESFIKKNHNYKVPEISYYDLKGSEDIIKWINDNTI